MCREGGYCSCCYYTGGDDKTQKNQNNRVTKQTTHGKTKLHPLLTPRTLTIKIPRPLPHTSSSNLTDSFWPSVPQQRGKTPFPPGAHPPSTLSAPPPPRTPLNYTRTQRSRSPSREALRCCTRWLDRRSPVSFSYSFPLVCDSDNGNGEGSGLGRDPQTALSPADRPLSSFSSSISLSHRSKLANP